MLKLTLQINRPLELLVPKSTNLAMYLSILTYLQNELPYILQKK